MYKMKYPNLFKPLKVGDVTLRNRIISAPQGFLHLDAESLPTQAAAAFYEEKARGGAAVVTIGEGYVDTVHGIDIPKGIHLDTDDCIGGLSLLADAVNKHGAVASMELQHAGMYASESYVNGNQIYAPVERMGEGTKAGARLHGVLIPEMPEEVILDTIEKFAQAALRCKQAGFGMVLVHGGHGWLLNQMMSPVINTRTDKWGGSLENRMRMPIAVCDRIREVCGRNFLIDFRFSAADVCNPGGYTPEDGIEMAKMIDGHVDFIHCSVGNHEVEESFVVVHPSMFLEDACNLKYAKEVKKHVKTPVVAVGAFSDPQMMEDTLAEGAVDAIAMARGLIADPDFPLKARQGKDEDINRCLRCYQCFSGLLDTRQFCCAINPVIGRELENKFDTTGYDRKKVLVAGGGIGGMQAALEAAKRRHEVILVEKTGRLGGALLCEEKVSFKKNLDLYLAAQARRVMEHPGIEVRLNTAATKELAEEITPDAIIAALGARPVIPSFLPGYDRPNVAGAEEVYYDLAKAGQKVVILGGGLVGCELGIHLALNGRRVTILEMASAPNFSGNMLHGEAVTAQIDIHGIRLMTETEAVEIKDDGVAASGPDGKVFVEADTVIYAVGQKSLENEVEELRFCAPEFYSIGDCSMPANIAKATKEGYYAARDIGRI
ncbi:oxidoreductase [Dorea sp. D27]|uniref:oxidoreductase n=1 Tax=Dorea sp. D27 TaxID=658665 RepID=UPI00067315C7|nr:FAD-dependent oxidoreductase [Dorea sp. D27]KMZ54425.1 NADH oxidase [Dorea sp. D27]